MIERAPIQKMEDLGLSQIYLVGWLGRRILKSKWERGAERLGLYDQLMHSSVIGAF